MAVSDEVRAVESSVARAYEQIVDRLARGEYAPGTWLRERSLADSMGMSRTPVREALSKLSSEGLVRLERNRGAMVVSWSREEVEEIYGLRAIIEGYVASVAARKINAADLAELEAKHAEYERVVAGVDPSSPRIAELNDEFHAKILQSTANDHLIHLATGGLALPMVRRTFLRYTARDLERSIEHHRELIEAFRHRDSETAELIMRAHIRSAQRALLEQEEFGGE